MPDSIIYSYETVSVNKSQPIDDYSTFLHQVFDGAVLRRFSLDDLLGELLSRRLFEVRDLDSKNVE